jgi:recombination DNA repair RAD52 pathway protein
MANQNNTDLALVSADDLSLVDNNALNAGQLKLLLKKTPTQYVHSRPAKGGGQWEYVTGGYVRKVLNLMFGWQWSFEILDEKIMHKEAIVKGKLTCTSNGVSIVKMQYGNKDIICRKGTDEPLSIGNDLKAAATDALKKCAAELGIAADIYNKLDFKEVAVDTTSIDRDDLKELYELKKDSIAPDEQIHMERILAENETKSFPKMHKSLMAL